MKIKKITAAASAALMLIGSVSTAGITVPMNVSAAESGEITQEYGITYNVVKDGAALTLASGAEGDFEIPESVTINGKEYPVVEIGKNAFKSLDGLTGLKMPDTVKRLDDYAVRYCHNLKTVKFSKNLEEIGEGAFAMCDSLEEITLPDSVKSIGDDFLSGCKKIQKLVFPPKITGNIKFEDISDLEELTLPEEVTGSVCLEGLPLLKEITFPKEVTDNVLLERMAQLEKFTLPEKMSGTLTLRNLPHLNSLTLTANNAKSIELYNLGISSLVLPDELTVPVSVSGLDLLENITFSSGMEEMQTHTLLECENLKNVIIPDGVKKMSGFAINRCFIDTLDISETVEKMESSAISSSTINTLVIRNKDIEDLSPILSGYNTINVIMGYSGSPAETYAGMKNIEFIPLDIEKDADLDEGEISMRRSLLISDPELAESIGYSDDAETVVIPEKISIDGKDYTVAKIDEILFKFKGRIKSVTLPDTVKIIDSCAFYMCSALGSLKVPNSVTEIKDCTFYGCDSLSDIELPEKLTKIGKCSFMNCPSLTSVDIPDGVTEIGNSAFEYCERLSSVNLPSSLETLEGYVFSNCPALETIEIPENVSKLDTNVFSGCNLSCITINNPDMEIVSSDTGVLPVKMICGHKGSTAQEYAEKNSIAFLAVEDQYVFCELIEKYPELSDKYIDADGVLNIPEKITSDGTEYSINSLLFPEKYRNTAVKKIVLPPSVSFIDKNICTYFPNLETIELTEGRTEIDYALFGNLKGVKEVILPSTIRTINAKTFMNCSGLQTVNIPEGIEEIREDTFNGCKGLKSITIPDGTVKIGDYAFANCTSLESLVFPDGVETIGNNIIDGDTALTALRFPDSIEHFGTNNICECKMLKELKLPKCLKIITSQLTGNLPYLETLILPDGIISIEPLAFEYCKSLKSIVIPDTVKNIGFGAFTDNDSLENVVLPKNITSVCSETFARCPKLRNVEIPEGVVEIDSDAFMNCPSLCGIVIPESVKYIEANAFSYCNISELTILNKSLSLNNICSETKIGTIHGYDGSTAHKYAEKNGIDFVAVSFISGDANRDGQVDLADVVLIMQSLANPPKYGINGSDLSHITAQGISNADVIGNDGMTNLDALTIQKYKLGLVDSLPVEE